MFSGDFWDRKWQLTFVSQAVMLQNVASQLVVWLSGNALVVINEVTLRQARLIQGWVTVCGQVNHLGM